MVVKEELNMGVTTSLVPVIQARRNEYPRSRYCDIFSVTIIELSIIIPNARINPASEMIFRDILHR